MMIDQELTIGAGIAGFVAGLEPVDVPPDVWQKARLAVLHNLSVAVAGKSLAPVALALAERMPEPRSGGGRALLTGRRLAPGHAAFVNACLVHARAQDDVYFPGLTHVGAATIPALLALGEDRGSSGEEMLLALVAGYEVAGAMSQGYAPRTTSEGWRASGIYGVFGAAMAASRLLGLDAERTGNALGIAASFAAGTNQTWVSGTQEWQFQLGAAARNGLEAALIAEVGGTGAPDALEGGSGFYRAFLHDGSDVSEVGADLGTCWRTRAVTFKPYPVCAILQAPVTEALKVRGARLREVSRARLTLSPGEASYPGTDGRPPFTDPGAALMSAPFCLAVALSGGTVTAADLFRSREAELVALSRRIEVVADPGLAPRSFRLEVEFSEGVETTSFDADDTTFNWGRDELVDRVHRLAGEVPAAIVLDDLVAVCEALESHTVADLVEVCVE